MRRYAVWCALLTTLFIINIPEVYSFLDYEWPTLDKINKWPTPDIDMPKNDLFLEKIVEPDEEEDISNRIITFNNDIILSLEDLRTKFSGLNQGPPLPKEEQVIEIADNIWDQMTDIDNLAEMETLLGIQLTEEPEEDTDILSGRSTNFISSHRPMAKSNAGNYWSRPESASCEPERRTVELDLPVSQDVIYIPTCVRAKQCGGCCTNELQSCQPLALKDITVKVIKVSKLKPASYRTRGRGGRRRRSSRAQFKSVNATIKEHTDCSCRCKLKEAQCDLRVHVYNDRLCSCDCINSEDMAKCHNEPAKFWNKTSCFCQCQKTSVCSSGFEFDHGPCSCLPVRAELNTEDGNKNSPA